MSETRYKFLNVTAGALVSAHGRQDWRLGEWYEVEGTVELCENGFHCSERLSEAFSYVQGEAVARVEVEGRFDTSDDKQAWQRMRLVDVRGWRREDSIALSIFAASLVLDNFERVFPGDDRPRKAIEAAQAYLNNPTEESRSAADSAAYSAANSAYSARSAANSARSAANSARSAADSARSAANSADSAADSADSAADSANSAAAISAVISAYWARSAARSARSAADSARNAIVAKVSDWMEARFEELPVWTAA